MLRDTPIYVQFKLGWNTGCYFWFAIEEKGKGEGILLQPKRLKQSSPLDSRCRVFEIESESEEEESKSRSYYKLMRKRIHVDTSHGIRLLNLVLEPETQGNLNFGFIQSRLHIRDGNLNKIFGAATFNDNWINSVGYPLYGLRPKSLLESPEDTLGFPHVLGVAKANTTTKLFVYTEGRRTQADTNTMFCYDSESDEWEVINKFSWGSWSTGVVLQFSSDGGSSYLFSIGDRHPTDIRNRSPPSVYAFDINGRQWLPKPVAGISHLLPNSREDTFLYPSLLQIQKHDHTKLSLVWCTHDFCSNYKIHWSKFYLHQGHLHSNFFAEVLSFGDFTVHRKLHLILRDCTVGL